MADLTDVSTKIAAALLLQHREISVGDIRALPFVESDDDAWDIVGALCRSFRIDMVQRRDPTNPIPAWEDILQLREVA